ncbi:SAM-dependent methyltransferase [Salinivibrio sp. VYel6]|uniref:SAM-dependent methyltransferase n=1 Tax=Salinivibrio sp. VYel6 TaxID=2490493 RepID=UPI00128CD3F0|nr:SAM-dependent methyltransferase [Salinivibrio sp. VYel6]MPX98095.1 SAM-dependent methyltransferase [Salinivibrio sp. VYel6]
MKTLVLDACCGSKMLWFDNDNPLTLFNDVRSLDTTLCDGRPLVIKPDTQEDFRNLSFADGVFKMVLFDPPHLNKVGDGAWMALKYGKLNDDWKSDLTKGFSECFRVLEDGGVLVFKWNEVQIKTKEVIQCSPYQPMFGHISGKRADTHWILFFKNSAMSKSASKHSEAA